MTYPVTIIKARYQGVYEGAPWLAFNVHAEDVPPAATADDVSCGAFFSSTTLVIGRGKTPDQALDNLAYRLLVEET